MPPVVLLGFRAIQVRLRVQLLGIRAIQVQVEVQLLGFRVIQVWGRFNYSDSE